MDINDLLRAYRGSAKEVSKLEKEDFEQLETVSWEYEEFQRYCEQNNIDIDKFCKTDGVFNNIFYVDYEKGTYIECNVLNEDYLDIMKFPHMIQGRSKHQMELFKNKDYEMFYFTIPKPLMIYDFEKRYRDIDTSCVVDAWLYIYTRLDYGFDVWNKEVLEYVFSFRKPVNIKKPITIYRGIGTESTPIAQAYSWTTDLNVALWFATRKGWGDCIAKATVYPEDILFLVDDRNEKEVIVRYEDLKDLEYLDMESADKDSLSDNVYAYIDDYRFYGESLKYLDFREGWHNKSHTARVLYYSLMLSDRLGLNDDDKEILVYCSLLHDIGRINDVEDAEHGRYAVKKIESEAIVLADLLLSNKDIYIAKRIIECHCIDDENGIELINNDSNIKDKERAVLLYKVFKDCDCLDRVRFDCFKREFDINYLRFEESKSLLLLVAGLFMGEIDKVVLGNKYV